MFNTVYLICREVDVSSNRKAVIVHVPYRLRKAFQKIHARLVRELEKKFSGKDVVLIATRRILRVPKKGTAANRPRSRTLTAVHEAILEDLVYPSEIVGKRIRFRLDGSRIMRSGTPYADANRFRQHLGRARRRRGRPTL
jgi:small subunit ribosomal protein S7e